MPQRKGRKNSDVAKVQTYNSIRDQLQTQNAQLMRQRQLLLQRTQPMQNNQSYTNVSVDRQRTYINQMANLDESPSKSNPQKSIINNLKFKIQDIINWCQNYEQNTSQHGKLNQIIQAQRQVLVYLNELAPQIFGSVKNISSSRNKNSKKKKSKTPKAENIEAHPLEAFRSSIGDEAMEMIQQIQRKALLQIQSLRCDKINLMKRLNEQIRAHNQQKRIRFSQQNQYGNGRSQTRISPNIRNQNNKYMQVVEEQNQENFDSTPPMINTVPQSQSRRQGHGSQAGQGGQGGRNREQYEQQNQFIDTGSNQNQHYQQQTQQNAQQNHQQYQQQNSQQYQQNPQQSHQHHPSNSRIPAVIQPRVNQNSSYPQNNANSRFGVSQPSISPKNMQQTQKYNSQEQILLQMDRLKNQNERLKKSFTAVPNENVQLKTMLRAQISQLSSKIQQYQNLLITSSRKQNNIDPSQANFIAQQGNRLLRMKKSPEHRTTLGSYGNQEQEMYSQQIPRADRQQEMQKSTRGRATQDYSRPPLQTFSPLDKSYHSQNYKTGFSPSKYQSIIEQMRNAV